MPANRLTCDTVWHSELKGFGARRQRYTVSYVLKTRMHGWQRWLTIGKHGLPWTPNAARKQAIRFKIDPVSASEEDLRSESVEQVIDSFKAEYVQTLNRYVHQDVNPSLCLENNNWQPLS